MLVWVFCSSDRLNVWVEEGVDERKKSEVENINEQKNTFVFKFSTFLSSDLLLNNLLT